MKHMAMVMRQLRCMSLSRSSLLKEAACLENQPNLEFMSQLRDRRTTESQGCETVSSVAEVDGISLSVRKGSFLGYSDQTGPLTPQPWK
jgi:hypothetical protein